MATLQMYLITHYFIYSPWFRDCVLFIRDINSLVALMSELSAVHGNWSDIMFVFYFDQQVTLAVPSHIMYI